MSFVRFAVLAWATWAFVLPFAASAREQDAQLQSATAIIELDTLFVRLTAGSLALVDAHGRVLASRSHGAETGQPLTDTAFAHAIRSAAPPDEQIVLMWEFFANRDNSGFLTLPVIKALAGITASPRAREALWSELVALSRAARSSDHSNATSLLTFFEANRHELLPLLPPVRETEGAGDEMALLMTTSQVFGGDIWESLADMVARNPAAVARHIERQRERGRAVKWEYQAFEGLMKWRDARLIAALRQTQAPEDIDAAGETFISIFNSMHTLDDWFRVQMLKGLGPSDLFNAVVSGEQQLYRLGTSGYRDFLHPVILKGIKDSGSFEAFIERATQHVPRDAGQNMIARRGIVFMRIASSFGLLDSVLDTVRDRDSFVSGAIDAMGDPRSFEGSTAIVIDILTGRSQTPQSIAFKRAFLDRLYELYGAERDPARRIVYGSMLSAYQTVTSDRRNRAIDSEYPVDQSMLRLPFDRVFKKAAAGGLVHRMFMRMHDDIDASSTFSSIQALMRSLGASVQDGHHHTVFRIGAPGRKIEIYVNDPSSAGIRHGIAAIAQATRGAGVETVIGRGHTGIISALQTDARRVLGTSKRSVATVILGTCGSDASVHDMIETFGYAPFITTKSSGHQPINNAIIETYIRALIELKPGAKLSMTDVLDRALARFLRLEANEELREDAKLYHVNVATALAAQLFDSHVRRHTGPQQRVSR